jgi:hypothetical protein
VLQRPEKFPAFHLFCNVEQMATASQAVNASRRVRGVKGIFEGIARTGWNGTIVSICAGRTSRQCRAFWRCGGWAGG